MRDYSHDVHMYARVSHAQECVLELMVQTPKARLTATKKSATCENSLLLLFVGKPQLKHVPAEK